MPTIKGRTWMITAKNWGYWDEPECLEAVANHEDPDGTKPVRYLSIGKHLGPQRGYQHCHINLELEKPKNLSWIKGTLFGRGDLHCELRRGSREQTDAYLTKDGFFREVANTRRLQPGRRTDLEDIKQMIDDDATLWEVYNQHFASTVRYSRGLREYIALRINHKARNLETEPPQVIVYVGPAGSGKSWHCYQDADYKENGYRFPIQMHDKIYFDGYDNETTIWFDEFNGRTLPFTTFCQLADRFSGRYETKGGSVQISGLKKILISTIAYPSTWWAGSARFNLDPHQLYRRLTKCYYLGPPRRTADGDIEYALPLEFNPAELRTRDDEDILRRHVKYPSDVQPEEDPDATEEYDSEATIDED